MTIVRRSSPFGELMTLRSAMDRLFEDSFIGPRSWSGLVEGSGSLALDISTTPDELRVEASLPGFKQEDVEITIEGSTLTISGHSNEQQEKKDGNYLVHEIRRGSFRRVVSLPEGLEADRASATFENGILTLRVPNAEKVKPRQIRISPVAEGRLAAEPSASQPSNGQPSNGQPSNGASDGSSVPQQTPVATGS